MTCAEVVNRGTSDKKHGYVFEIDPRADAAVPAVPVPQAGRFEHEGGRLRGGIVYLTEDRRIEPDPVLVRIGAEFYRFVPDRRIGAWGTLGGDAGCPAGAQAARRVPRQHGERPAGLPFAVEWSRSTTLTTTTTRTTGATRAGLHADAHPGP